MAPFGGFEMPIQYTGVKEEHHAVRKSLGVFDVSHMGEFYVKGSRALKLLERVCSNSIAQLPVGKAQYNYLPNRIGGIIDDLIVYRLAKNSTFLMHDMYPQPKCLHLCSATCCIYASRSI